MSLNRCTEPGWLRIGIIDDAGRRSLWIRETYRDDNEGFCRLRAIELCAGREGDDAYVLLTPDNPQWRDLSEVLACARFATQWSSPDGNTSEDRLEPNTGSEIQKDRPR